MNYKLTIKGEELTPQAEKIIVRQVSILEKKLHNFTADIPQLSIVIKKHDKNHFFSETMTLSVPKKNLVAKAGGHKLTDVLHAGFDILNKEFEVYKAKHFKGSSKYPYHVTINESIADLK